MRATETCTLKFHERSTIDARIYILLGYQVTLNSKITSNCKQSLEQLLERNHIRSPTLLPDDKEINTPVHGPEYICGVSKCHTKRKPREWELNHSKRARKKQRSWLGYHQWKWPSGYLIYKIHIIVNEYGCWENKISFSI